MLNFVTLQFYQCFIFMSTFFLIFSDFVLTKIQFELIIIIVTIIVIKIERGISLANLKYSRQREAIKEYLNTAFEHPTADTVYMNVRKEFPNISLGTVYRNLNLLAELGEAVKLSTPIGGDRFDGTVAPHYHFCCTCCGKIIDLPLNELTDVNKKAGKDFDGTIERHTMMFYGTCGDCLKKNLQIG